MSTAVIGATGRVGSEIVRGLLARGDAVAALVRDPGKARRAFGEPGGLRIRPTRLDDPRDLTAALDWIRAVFIAMGSTGTEGVLQRITISATAGISSIDQVTRLSVLNASAGSLGINQRAHHSIDQVRRLRRRAVLDDPPRDLLRVAARRGPRGTRLAHLDRSGLYRPDGPDRPPRRGRGRATRARPTPGCGGRTTT